MMKRQNFLVEVYVDGFKSDEFVKHAWNSSNRAIVDYVAKKAHDSNCYAELFAEVSHKDESGLRFVCGFRDWKIDNTLYHFEITKLPAKE